jgi:DNA polymerase-3 subunit delta'
MCVGRSESIKVSDVDGIISFTSLAPFISKKRIVVLDNAENMSVEASNRLLKVMEEPPDHVHFFIVTSDPAKIMPTVASRCTPFKFGRLSRLEITDILWKRMGFDLPKATTLGWIASGSSSDVFSDPGSYIKNRDMAVGLMQSLKAKDPLDAMDFIDRVERADTGIFVDMFMMVLTDLIALKEGGREINNPDIRKDLEKISEDFSGKALAVTANFVIQSKRGKKLNVNGHMALKYALIKAHPLLAVKVVAE